MRASFRSPPDLHDLSGASNAGHGWDPKAADHASGDKTLSHETTDRVIGEVRRALTAAGSCRLDPSSGALAVSLRVLRSRLAGLQAVGGELSAVEASEDLMRLFRKVGLEPMAA